MRHGKRSTATRSIVSLTLGICTGLTGTAHGNEPPEPRPSESRTIFQSQFRIGGGYDSNVGPFGRRTTLPTNVSSTDDWFSEASADFNLSQHSLLPHWGGRGLAIGIGGSASGSWYDDLDSFDRERFTGRSFLDYELARDLWPENSELHFSLQYQHEARREDGRQISSSNLIEPSLTMIWKRDWKSPRWFNDLDRTDLYFAHEDLDDRRPLGAGAALRSGLLAATNPGGAASAAGSVRQARTLWRENRDGTYQRIGLQHVFTIEMDRKPKTLEKQHRRIDIYDDDYARIRIGYEWREDSPVGEQVDRGGHVLLYGVRIPLMARLAFEADGEFAWYDHAVPSYRDSRRRTRSDFVHQHGLFLVHDLYSQQVINDVLLISLRGGAEMTFQDSNVFSPRGGSPFDYTRVVYGVQLSFSLVPINTSPGSTQGIGTMTLPAMPVQLPPPPPPP